MRQYKRQRQIRQKNKERTQSGFSNKYDFAYAGRGTVNQLGKIATGLINNICSKINKIAQQRINQIIRREEKKFNGYFQTLLGEQLRIFTKHLFGY